MPDKDGELLPPIEEFDGDKQSVELKMDKCNHKMKFISPTDIRCTKCGVGFTGTAREIKEVYDLFDNVA
jgi:hypothetical protein